MLSSVLRSPIEGVLAAHGSQFGEHARLIQEGFEAIRRLMEAPEPPRKRIGFRAPSGKREARSKQ